MELREPESKHDLEPRPDSPLGADLILTDSILAIKAGDLLITMNQGEVWIEYLDPESLVPYNVAGVSTWRATGEEVAHVHTWQGEAEAKTHAVGVVKAKGEEE